MQRVQRSSLFGLLLGAAAAPAQLPAVPGDRRRIRLCCTDTAQPIILRGRKVQTRFFRALWADTPPELRAAFEQAMDRMDRNLDVLLKEEVK